MLSGRWTCLYTASSTEQSSKTVLVLHLVNHTAESANDQQCTPELPTVKDIPNQSRCQSYVLPRLLRVSTISDVRSNDQDCLDVIAGDFQDKYQMPER